MGAKSLASGYPYGYWQRPIAELAVAYPATLGGKDGYIRVRRGGRTCLLHRLVWEHFNGPVPGGQVLDHINGCRTDNRLSNLRVVTRHLNNANMCRRKDNTSGLTGVEYTASGHGSFYWTARWKENGKTRSKCFNIAKHGDVEAKRLACAYRAAQLERLGGYTERHGL